MWNRIWPWALAAAVFAADRATKMFAGRIPADGTVLVPGVVGLRYTENRGIAFSMLSGRPWLLGVFSLLAIAAAFLYLRKKEIRPLSMAGLMMMLGGAAGNMVDRFVTGYVPDMIEFLFVRFAIFNVADAFLCIGCALVMISLLIPRGKHGKGEADE